MLKGGVFTNVHENFSVGISTTQTSQKATHSVAFWEILLYICKCTTLQHDTWQDQVDAPQHTYEPLRKHMQKLSLLTQIKLSFLTHMKLWFLRHMRLSFLTHIKLPFLMLNGSVSTKIQQDSSEDSSILSICYVRWLRSWIFERFVMGWLRLEGSLKL